MKERKPHQYCGILILLLSMLSLFAWRYHPPAHRRVSRPIVLNSTFTLPDIIRASKPHRTLRDKIEDRNRKIEEYRK
jgi:hypothetical protein